MVERTTIISFKKGSPLKFYFLTILSFLSFRSFSIMPATHCYQAGSCNNNFQVFGRPMYGIPFYPFPTLRYHSFLGPRNFYFRPYPMSPYRPTWMNNCLHCGGMSPTGPQVPLQNNMPLTKRDSINESV